MADHSIPNGRAAMRRNLAFLAQRSPLWALAALCLSSVVATVAYQAEWIDRIGEVGYGDGWILDTVQQLQRTGIIYAPPVAWTPLPKLSFYGPLLYTLLAVPGRVVPWENPFVGPRLIESSVFVLCILVTASIAHALLRHALAWRWSVLLALSAATMRPWIMQIRGDFPAILFALLSLRMLLTRSRWAVLLAGACAGFATLFKQSYVSAMIAGFLWLVLQRRWRPAAQFIASAIATSLGLYFLFSLREPAMFGQILSMRHPLTEYPGIVRLIWQVCQEPVALLGLGALPFVVVRLRRRWWLLVTYLVVSFIVSATAEAQVGGNVNYFFEALFVITPLAAYGALQLGRCRAPAMSLFLAGLLLTQLTEPVKLAYTSIRYGRQETREFNRQMVALHTALKSSRVLSTVPTVTQLTPEPILVEPFLATHLERIGLLDLRPLAKRIRDHEFDLVVTLAAPAARGYWRGVPKISPTLRTAIAASYQPYCAFKGWLFFRPAYADKPRVLEKLDAIGCDAIAARASENSW